jgi:hypothetical protein
MKVPDGGLVFKSLLPQQATVPLALTPHAQEYPALMDVKTPEGGEAWPYVLSPQQAIVPAVCIPHA